MTQTWKDANAFWNSTEERRDQRFYTAFCMLTNMLQNLDDATAFATNPVSEWRVVISYYTLMHSMRLPLLLAVGDFPRSHSALPSFLKGKRKEVKADWLSRFLDSAMDKLDSKHVKRDDVISWLEQIVDNRTDWSEWLHGRGKVLSAFKECRNRLNYEGLIAGHRAAPPSVSHSRVSPVMSSLQEIAARVMVKAIEDSTEIFRSFVDQFDRKGCWNSYLNWNGQNHSRETIYESGQQRQEVKIEGVQFLERILNIKNQTDIEHRDFLKLMLDVLRGPPAVEDVRLSEEVARNTSLGLFGEKSKAMNRFSSDVYDLSRFVGQFMSRIHGF